MPTDELGRAVVEGALLDEGGVDTAPVKRAADADGNADRYTVLPETMGLLLRSSETISSTGSVTDPVRLTVAVVGLPWITTVCGLSSSGR